jgi:E3 ubiquitin-protein ligase SHPRH
LIVTPPSLWPQWDEELKRHAPHLRILHYQGWTKIKLPLVADKKDKGKGKSKEKAPTKGKGRAKQHNLEEEYDDWVSYAASFDVVLTTYTVLQADLNVAKPPVKRPRREIAYYQERDRARSPLIAVEYVMRSLFQMQDVNPTFSYIGGSVYSWMKCNSSVEVAQRMFHMY